MNHHGIKPNITVDEFVQTGAKGEDVLDLIRTSQEFVQFVTIAQQVGFESELEGLQSNESEVRARDGKSND